MLSFLKETLGDKIADARISRILKSHAVCMTADGPVSLEMEKYFKRNGGEAMPGMTAQRVLELNSEAPAFAALKRAVAEDRELAAKYADCRSALGGSGGVCGFGVRTDEIAVKSKLGMRS